MPAYDITVYAIRLTMKMTANQMTKVGQTGKMLRKYIRVQQIKLHFP